MTESVFPWQRVAKDLQAKYQLGESQTTALSNELATALNQGVIPARDSLGVTTDDFEPSMLLSSDNSAVHVWRDDVNEWLKSRHPFEWVLQNTSGTRQQVQEQLIIDELQRMGYKPCAIPKYRPGHKGIKAAVKKVLVSHREFHGTTTFDKAWDRLRNTGKIADSQEL